MFAKLFTALVSSLEHADWAGWRGQRATTLAQLVSTRKIVETRLLVADSLPFRWTAMSTASR